MFRRLLSGAIIFFLSIYLPMASFIYWPGWGKLHCGINERCNNPQYQQHLTAIEDLAAYFRHQQNLGAGWSAKERLHLAEVRVIYDRLFILVVIMILLLTVSLRPKMLFGIAKANIIILPLLFLILPFFSVFWDDIFHTLMFDNLLWKNNKQDISYYITPKSYFKYVIGGIVVGALFLNAILLGLAKSRGWVDRLSLDSDATK